MVEYIKFGDELRGVVLNKNEVSAIEKVYSGEVPKVSLFSIEGVRNLFSGRNKAVQKFEEDLKELSVAEIDSARMVRDIRAGKEYDKKYLKICFNDLEKHYKNVKNKANKIKEILGELKSDILFRVYELLKLAFKDLIYLKDQLK